MPDATLRRGFATYRLELRLFGLHWSFWVLQIIWTVFVAGNFTGYTYMTPRSLLLSTFYLSVIPFLSLGCMFLSAFSASRARRSHFDVMEWTLPTGAEIILARWLALVTVMATLLIVPLVVAARSGAFEEFVANLPTFLLEGLSVLALTSAIVWLLQSTIGIKRWMYPLFGLLWLGSLIVSVSLNTEVFPWSLLLNFTANAGNGYIYSAFWGRLTLGNLPAFTAICYLGALLLLLGLIGWQVIQRRRYRLSLPALLATGVGFVIMMVGTLGYSSVVEAANTQRAQIGQKAVQNYPEIAVTLPADLLYLPTQYDLTLDVSDFANPTFALGMELTNRGDAPLQDLTFTLNSQLEIIDANVPFERAGDDLVLHLPDPLAPGGSITINLNYRGVVWWYGHSTTQGRPDYALDFIKPEGVNLSCPVAWYPIPGHNLVGRNQNYEDHFTPDCMLTEPAVFTLHVFGAEASPLRWASNLPKSVDELETFSGTSSWAHLLAAPNLVSETLVNDTITLIAPDSLLSIAESAVEGNYAPALTNLQHFYPDISHLTLFVTDAGFGTEFETYTTSATAGALMVVASPFDLAYVDVNALNRYEAVGQAMVTSLFGLEPNLYTSVNGLVESVGFFTWIFYLADGDAEQMLGSLENDLPQGTQGTQRFSSQSPAERNVIAHALYDVYVEQGQAVVTQVLRQIRADAPHLVALTPQEIITWIKETAHDADPDAN